MDQPPSQSDSSSSPSYFDPEAVDTSEEQFSASLEAPAERPQFIVDLEGESAGSEQAESEFKNSARVAFLEAEQVRAAPTGIPDAAEQDGREHDWRKQVSSKVSKYKERRPQTERYPSLSLPFGEPAEPRKPSFAAMLTSEIENAHSEKPAVMERAVPETYQPIVMESTARVLEFPRVGPAIPGDELAEPVFYAPRIVEAPEVMPLPPALGGILIEPIGSPEPERRPGVDFPLQSASILWRLLAAMLDGVVIAAALVGFGYIFLRMNTSFPPIRLFGSIAAGLALMLWMAYQYGFLVHTGSTPGLRLTKLQVRRFDGSPAPRNLRLWRVLASFLSCASLALGYAWCFLDEDQLCWHDRITRTHLARR
jgi:uncharacterized RDD family membrane protein YckC